MLSLNKLAAADGLVGVSNTPVGNVNVRLMVVKILPEPSTIYPARKADLTNGLALGLLTGLILMLAEPFGSLKRRHSPRQGPT
jgi:hypothetical protein